MKNVFGYFCLILILFTSCSIKKRTYRNGYYINWAHHKTRSIPSSDLKKEKSEEVTTKKIYLPKNEISVTDYITSNSNDLVQSSISKPILLINSDTCGDILLLKNGDRISAKVIEVNESSIKYKRCDNLNGPTYSASRSSIHSITYSNGSKEIIEPERANSYTTEREPENIKTTHDKATYALVLSILAVVALFLFAVFMLLIFSSGYVSILYVRKLLGIIFLLSLIPIGSILLGRTATKAIDAEPDKYKGKGIVSVSKIISIIVISCFVLLGLIFLIIG